MMRDAVARVVILRGGITCNDGRNASYELSVAKIKNKIIVNHHRVPISPQNSPHELRTIQYLVLSAATPQPVMDTMWSTCERVSGMRARGTRKIASVSIET